MVKNLILKHPTLLPTIPKLKCFTNTQILKQKNYKGQCQKKWTINTQHTQSWHIYKKMRKGEEGGR